MGTDFSMFDMGNRSRRFSLLVKDGEVFQLNIEQGGKFEVWNAETLLGQAYSPLSCTAMRNGDSAPFWRLWVGNIKV